MTVYDDLIAMRDLIDEAEEALSTPLLLHCNPWDMWVALDSVRKARERELARGNYTARVRHVTVCPAWHIPKGRMVMSDPLKILPVKMWWGARGRG